MQKLKTAAVPAILILSVLFIVFSGCQKQEKKSQQNYFYESKSKTNFNLEDQNQLSRLVSLLANETQDIKLLENAMFTELIDSKGAYKAIVARYKVNDLTTRMVIPLKSSTLSSVNNAETIDKPEANYYVVDGCEMKCTSAWGCSECNQKIIERCKEQTCSCSGNGGCSSKITFPEYAD